MDIVPYRYADHPTAPTTWGALRTGDVIRDPAGTPWLVATRHPASPYSRGLATVAPARPATVWVEMPPTQPIDRVVVDPAAESDARTHALAVATLAMAFRGARAV